MQPHDFQILGHTIGYHHKIAVESFDIGEVDFRTQDTPHPRADRMLFGRDYTTPPVWTFELATNPRTFVEGVDALAELESAWLTTSRMRPGWYTWLRYERAGEVRKVAGRPRKWGRSHTKTFQHGVVRAVAEFQLMDTLSYTDETNVLRITTVPGRVGGYTFPIIFPWGTRATGGRRQGMITINGTVPTPATVVIHGPVTGPVVTGPGWRLSFPRLTLKHDQRVTIDPRAQSVRRNDGASMVGWLEKFYFDRLTLKPGDQEITFEGTDSSGTSWCEVRWSEAINGF